MESELTRVTDLSVQLFLVERKSQEVLKMAEATNTDQVLLLKLNTFCYKNWTSSATKTRQVLLQKLHKFC